MESSSDIYSGARFVVIPSMHADITWNQQKASAHLLSALNNVNTMAFFHLSKIKDPRCLTDLYEREIWSTQS